MSEAIFVQGLTKAYLGVRTGGILLPLCVICSELPYFAPFLPFASSAGNKVA